MIWFTSDFHLFHKNVLRYDNRPFATVDEMHETIIHNWNEVVNPNDVVYYLGDLTFGNTRRTKEILFALKGRIIYIKGNHDKEINKYSERFEDIYDYYHLSHNKKRYVLFHYPILSWPGIYRGSIHLHGHCHNNLRPIYNVKGEMLTAKRMDVGCMIHNYYPISIEEVNKLMTNVLYKAVDHH